MVTVCIHCIHYTGISPTSEVWGREYTFTLELTEENRNVISHTADVDWLLQACCFKHSVINYIKSACVMFLFHHRLYQIYSNLVSFTNKQSIINSAVLACYCDNTAN